MKDEHRLSIVAIEHAAGWLYDLTIAGTLEFLRPTTTFWVVCQLLHMFKNALNKFCSRSRILQSNIVTDCIQIAQGRF